MNRRRTAFALTALAVALTSSGCGQEDPAAGDTSARTVRADVNRTVMALHTAVPAKLGLHAGTAQGDWQHCLGDSYTYEAGFTVHKRSHGTDDDGRLLTFLTKQGYDFPDPTSGGTHYADRDGRRLAVADRRSTWSIVVSDLCRGYDDADQQFIESPRSGGTVR